MPRSQEDINKFYVSLIHSRERKSSENVHAGDILLCGCRCFQTLEIQTSSAIGAVKQEI